MVNALSRFITLLGKHASYTLPIGVFLGLFFPFLSSFFKDYLVITLLVPLTLSLVRIETAELFRAMKNWRLVTLLTAWVLIACPIVMWALLSPLNIQSPILVAAIIAAAAPPVTACAAVALFLRINAAIAVVITVTTMLLVPVSLPLILKYLAPLQANINLWALSLNLAGFILLSFALAFVIKKAVPKKKLHASRYVMDGVSVVFISIFTIGIMNGISDLFFQNQWFVIETLIVSTCVVFFLYVISTILFWGAGPRTAMAIGLCSGNFNLGLMYIALEKHTSIDVLIFFGIGQIPMYCLPSLLAPIIQKLITHYEPKP